MNEKEALEYIKHLLLDENSLIAQLERGETLDERQILRLHHAFETLRHAWTDVHHIPKETVQLLRDAAKQLFKVDHMLFQSPEKYANVSQSFINIYLLLDTLFLAPTGEMSEEAALSLVTQHVFGTPSFNVQLFRGHVDVSAAKELFSALDTLATYWEGKAAIPKLAAQVLVNVPWLFRLPENAYFSAKEQRQLQEIERQIDLRVDRCLER